MNEPTAWESMLSKAERERDSAKAEVAELREMLDDVTAERDRIRVDAHERGVRRTGDGLRERNRADALQRQVDAVRALHTLVDSTVGGRRLKHAVCAEDAARMPCPTIAALDAAEPADQPQPTPEADETCTLPGVCYGGEFYVVSSHPKRP